MLSFDEEGRLRPDSLTAADFARIDRLLQVTSVGLLAMLVSVVLAPLGVRDHSHG